VRAAVFLDRDGVINIDRAYVHRWEDFEFVPGAVRAMARLCEAGFRLVIVTNQSGLARGFYAEPQYEALTRRMLAALAQDGIVVDGVYHCPHHPLGTVPALAHECDCRKPMPGMILRAAAEHGLSLPNSVLVGDKPSDIEAARAAGVGRAFIVQTDGLDPLPERGIADAAFRGLADCVQALLAPEGVAAKVGDNRAD
jgi:D-glycero-D-manno-heptose 1,7-bisphosphate phosphatase